VQVGFFSDGHNHYHDMKCAIEQISENQKFVVSLAHNNTVAIWEKVPPPYNAHGYALPDRRALSSGRTVPYGTRGPYLKSILFKFPPSVVYMMPGSELMVVIGTASGKVLVWQTYSNYLLKGHLTPIVEAIGFYRGDSTFLATISTKDNVSSLKVWDLTPGLERVGPEKRPIACGIFAGKLENFKHDPATDQIITFGETVCIWNPWVNPGRVEMEPVFQIKKDKKISCIQIDGSKGLLFLAQEDGFILIYFLVTCQIIAKIAPTRSNQYSSIFDFQMDQHTFVTVDDHCIHYKVLNKDPKSKAKAESKVI